MNKASVHGPVLATWMTATLTLHCGEFAPAVDQEHRKLCLLPRDTRRTLSLEGLQTGIDEGRHGRDEEFRVEVGDGFQGSF